MFASVVSRNLQLSDHTVSFACSSIGTPVAVTFHILRITGLVPYRRRPNSFPCVSSYEVLMNNNRVGIDWLTDVTSQMTSDKFSARVSVLCSASGWLSVSFQAV